MHGSHGLPFGAFFFLTKMGRDFASGFDADLAFPAVLFYVRNPFTST